MAHNFRKPLHTTSLTLLVALFFAAQAWAAPTAKVNVCHVPPGDPANFHTITVSEKALGAHLAHGDLAGACDDFCEALCDDGNACTIDDCGERGCSYSDVDCDDGNECTEDDSCDPQAGCLNEPLPATPCDDGNECTVADSCAADGTCAGESVAGCCLDATDCDDGRLCTDDSCLIASGEFSGTCLNEDVVCDNPDLCSTAACDELTGACTPTEITCTPSDQCHDPGICDTATGECSDPVKPNGSPCDDGIASTEGEACLDGICTAPAGATTCPCVAQPGWQDKVDVVTASAICSNIFFPQTYYALASGEGAALAIFNAGQTLCQWQDTGLPLNSMGFSSTLAEFQACEGLMTCGS